MNNMCSKKFTFLWSAILSLPVAFLFFTSMYDYKNMFLALFIFPFVFLFSLITYFLPEQVFRTWVKFATWWVGLQIVLTVLTPESSGGYFVSIIDKQFVAIILSGLFVVVSLFIVLISWFNNRA